jgi:tetratricopeptide (TPR) repeat protein
LLKAERDYERAAAELMAALEERRDLLAPETREALETSLNVIDQALADLRAALESDPGNRKLARLFNTTHRKRVELLRGAVRLSQS